MELSIHSLLMRYSVRNSSTIGIENKISMIFQDEGTVQSFGLGKPLCFKHFMAVLILGHAVRGFFMERITLSGQASMPFCF
jgi:hypothetical protein